MTSACVDVPTADGSMAAHLWLPPSGSGPGLLLLQEIFGISAYVERRAQDLADLGYVVLAPEIFWRLGQTRVPEGPQMLDEAMGLMGNLDWEAAVADAGLAFEVLSNRPEVTGGTGSIGFCFGGGLAFNVAAQRSPAVLVSYYGSALPGLTGLAEQVSCPQLHHFGDQDGYVDSAAQSAIREALRESPGEVSFETYPGADHAFDNDDFTLFHQDASRAAWRRTMEFLAQRLPADVHS